MTRIVLATAVAFAVATPAAAQEGPAAPVTPFNGGHVGVNLGLADDDFLGSEVFTYGLEAGYDVDLGAGVVGAVAEIQDSKDTDRELSIGGRLGVKPASNILVYGLIGYSNLKIDSLNLDGARFGAGVEIVPVSNFSIKLEQRYTNYELGAEAFQTLLGFGYRF